MDEPGRMPEGKPATRQRGAVVVALVALGMMLSPALYFATRPEQPATRTARDPLAINPVAELLAMVWSPVEHGPTDRAPPHGDVAPEGDDLYEAGSRALYGRGEPANDAKAAHLYQLCAQDGNAECEYALAYMYGEGRGVRQDDEKAFYWMERAARQGHAIAQDNLGVAYGDGRGVRQDWVKSYIWISRSAAQGNAQAKEDLRYARAHMNEEQVAEAEQALRLEEGEGKR